MLLYELDKIDEIWGIQKLAKLTRLKIIYIIEYNYLEAATGVFY